MKVVKIDYWKEDMDLTRPYAVTYVMHDSVQNIFIRIDGSDGTYGLGAGSPSMHVAGEEIDQNCGDRIGELSDVIVGTDIRSYRHTITSLALKYPDRPALLAALDMALHDLFCKYVGISLGHYLGVRLKPLATSITIGIKNVAETVAEGIEYKERSFKIIKLKIGQSKEEDIERTIKLREAVGPEMVIRVDANQGYDVQAFEDYLKKTNASNIEFFEQPMTPAKVNEMLSLKPSVRDICAADEELHKHQDAIRLAKMDRPFGIFNIKLMKCGGITEAKRIADVAFNERIDLMWGCMDESVISISASLNTALSCHSTRYLDLDGSFDLASDVATGGFKLKDGYLYPLLDQPGLGVTLSD